MNWNYNWITFDHIYLELLIFHILLLSFGSNTNGNNNNNSKSNNKCGWFIIFHAITVTITYNDNNSSNGKGSESHVIFNHSQIEIPFILELDCNIWL